MTTTSRGAFWRSVGLGALCLLGGCSEGTDAGPGAAGGPPTGPGGGKSSPEIKRIMAKLAKGPGSLTPTIGGELKADVIPWDAIQVQSKEYAQLAAEMATYEPVKGSKESWAKLAGEYAHSAADLDKAAQARDKPAALAAHGELARSCNGCHREHRAMGGPGGGPPPGGPGEGPH